MFRVYNKNNQVVVGKKQSITIDPDKEILILSGYGAEKTISLQGFNETLRKKYPNSNTNLESSELTTTLQIENISIKLILQSYGFKNPEFTPSDNQNEYLDISGYALVKE